MLITEKTKRKNDVPRSRRYLVLGLSALLILIFAIGLYLQSLVVLPDPTGQLYYGYTINPTLEMFYRHDFDGGESGLSQDRPLPTLISEAVTPTPRFAWEVTWRKVEYDTNDKETLKDELVVVDRAMQSVMRILGRFYVDSYWSTLDLSPDGKWLVLSAYNELVGWNKGDNLPQDLWLASIETGEVKRLTDTETDEREPAFMPDGKSLLYLSTADGSFRLYQMDLASGTSRLLTPDFNAQYYSWSPDRQHVIVKSYDPADPNIEFHQPHAGALYNLNLATGGLTTLISEPTVYEFTWSHDSQWIAYTTYDPMETLAQRSETAARGHSGTPYYKPRPSTLWIMRVDGSDRHAMDSSVFPLEGLGWRP
jgi:Tol biopolymer transport system component